MGQNPGSLWLFDLRRRSKFRFVFLLFVDILGHGQVIPIAVKSQTMQSNGESLH
jgi:hypothetical protein